MNVFLLFVVLFFSGKLGLVFDAANDSKLVSIGVISAVLKAGSSLLFQRALQLSPVSLSVPYLAFTPALLLVTSYFMLGERPEPAGVAGVFVMTAGAYGLNAAGRKDRQGGGGRDASSKRPGWVHEKERGTFWEFDQTATRERGPGRGGYERKENGQRQW